MRNAWQLMSRVNLMQKTSAWLNADWYGMSLATSQLQPTIWHPWVEMQRKHLHRNGLQTADEALSWSLRLQSQTLITRYIHRKRSHTCTRTCTSVLASSPLSHARACVIMMMARGLELANQETNKKTKRPGPWLYVLSVIKRYYLHGGSIRVISALLHTSRDWCKSLQGKTSRMGITDR